MSEVKVFTREEIPGEEFKDSLTGNDLLKILTTCPAKWKYDEKDRYKKSSFGLTAHTMMLDSETFDRTFFRMPGRDDYEGEVLASVSSLQGWLKERGIGGRSKSDPFELISIIKATCETSGEAVPFFWHEIERTATQLCGASEPVSAKDFDTVKRMRAVLLANEQWAGVVETGVKQATICCDLMGVPVRVRIDNMADDAKLWDYTTTTNAEPGFFIRNAFNLGHDVKLAMQYHAFHKAHGIKPEGVFMLAQETTAPFLAAEFQMTEAMLAIGTAKLKQALAIYKAARDSDVWASYNGGNTIQMDPPQYVMQQYKHLFHEEPK